MNHNKSNHSNKDLVCGRIINKVKAVATYRYKGNILYFCSVCCLDKFAKHPRHYPGKSHHRKLAPRMKLPINGMKGFHPYSAGICQIGNRC